MSTSVPDAVAVFNTMRGRYEGALKAFSRRPTPRAYRDFLRYSFAHNMSILRVLKEQKNVEQQRQTVINDNRAVLNMLNDLRNNHPEIFDSPAIQLSFTRELLQTRRK